MSQIMIHEPQNQVDLSPASVSECHFAPVSLDYKAHGTVWYRCHECNKSCSIRTIPSSGFEWCDKCHAKGYVKVDNPLALVGYDQTKLNRDEHPTLRKSKE